MESEMKTHMGNQTWTLQKLPVGNKVLTCKWFNKAKTKLGGLIKLGWWWQVSYRIMGLTTIKLSAQWQELAQSHHYWVLQPFIRLYWLNFMYQQSKQTSLYKQVEAVIYMTQLDRDPVMAQIVYPSWTSLFGLNRRHVVVVTTSWNCEDLKKACWCL